ncbi:hypothetical protein P8452_64897 [Trifolium repens]|nr:hypothetical protein P8452_64897 [Trifolium repens]
MVVVPNSTSRRWLWVFDAAYQILVFKLTIPTLCIIIRILPGSKLMLTISIIDSLADLTSPALRVPSMILLKSPFAILRICIVHFVFSPPWSTSYDFINAKDHLSSLCCR